MCPRFEGISLLHQTPLPSLLPACLLFFFFAASFSGESVLLDMLWLRKAQAEGEVLVGDGVRAHAERECVCVCVCVEMRKADKYFRILKARRTGLRAGAGTGPPTPLPSSWKPVCFGFALCFCAAGLTMSSSSCCLWRRDVGRAVGWGPGLAGSQVGCAALSLGGCGRGRLVAQLLCGE